MATQLNLLQSHITSQKIFLIRTKPLEEHTDRILNKKIYAPACLFHVTKRPSPTFIHRLTKIKPEKMGTDPDVKCISNRYFFICLAAIETQARLYGELEDG